MKKLEKSEKSSLKTIRVFVSSTFRDMHAERDYLNSFVFPELRSRCAKNGIEFIGVDLRWGITEEESRERKAMQVCLDEIKKCNFFISLLGDRYGWIPPPEEIPREFFESIRQKLDKKSEYGELLDHWYQLDEILKEPVYRLRKTNISNSLTNNDRIQYEDPGDEEIDDNTRAKLVQFWEEAGLEHAGDSITAREIFHALNENSVKKLFFYFRKSGVHLHSDFPEQLVPIFIENDPENKKKLWHLKQEIRKRSKKEIPDYEASYNGFRIDSIFLPTDLTDLEKKALEDGVIQPEEWQNLKKDFRSSVEKYGTVALTGIEKLGDIIHEDILKAIGMEPENVSLPLDPHNQEREYHKRFIENRTQLFVGRKDKLTRMLNYIIDKDDKTALVITGKPGCGKSALMAVCARQCSQKFPDTLAVPHFIGAAPGSTDLLSTIRSLCETLRRECNLEDELSEDPDKLRGQLYTFLEKAGSVRPIIILLDAVNQLDPAYRSHELTWLPITLPPKVRLIVSTLEGDCLDQLKKRVLGKNIINVPILPKKYRKSLIKKHLSRRGKKLLDKQITCLLDTKKRKEAGLPLYLLVALEELCLFGNYEELNHRINKLPATLNELFDQVIDRLEIDHTSNRTELILRLMAVSRYGLLESEILDQLGGEYLFNWESIPGNDINRLVKFLKNDMKICLPEKIEIIKTDDNKTIHVSSKEILIDIKLDEKMENAILKSSTGETCTLQLKREKGRLNIHKMVFPRIYWTRFYRSLEFYLRPVDESTGAGLINFYHDQLRFALYRRYLGMNSPDADKTEKYRLSHDQLADYFRRIASDKNEHGKWSIENPRSLIELPYHLHESGRDGELRKMLLDFGWMHAKLEAVDVNALIIDYDFITDDLTLNLLQSAIKLSAHVLKRDKMQLRSQMYGRLMSQDSSEIMALLNQIKNWKKTPWFRPIAPSLIPPGSPLIRTLTGHTHRIYSLAVLQDSKSAISFSGNMSKYELKIWDLESGNGINILTDLAWSVTAITAHPDGKRIISAYSKEYSNSVRPRKMQSISESTIPIYSDHILEVWDLGSGKVINTLSGHTGEVSAVAVLPDGKRVISASWDKTLIIWDIEIGKMINTLSGHTGEVSAVAVLPDGKHAISASWDKTLKVWDIESGKVINTLSGHTGEVSEVAVLPDGKRAISASWDKTLRVWDLETGKVINTLTDHSNYKTINIVSALAVLPDGKHAITAIRDKTLKVWDLENGKVINTLSGHTGEVSEVAVLPDGKRAISSSFDKTLKIWDLKSKNVIDIFTCHIDPVNSLSMNLRSLNISGMEKYYLIKDTVISSAKAVAVLPDEKRTISTSRDNKLKIWDMKSGKVINILSGHAELINAIAVLPDGKRAISASDDNTLKLWDLESGNMIHTLTGHTGSVRAVAMLPDGKRAISASDDNTLKLWDLKSGKVINTLTGHTEEVIAVLVLADGEHAVSASSNENKLLWDMSNRKVIENLPDYNHLNTYYEFALHPDGKFAMLLDGKSLIEPYNDKLVVRDNGKIITGFYGEGEIIACVVLQDGKTILAGEETGRMHLLRLEGAN